MNNGNLEVFFGDKSQGTVDGLAKAQPEPSLAPNGPNPFFDSLKGLAPDVTFNMGSFYKKLDLMSLAVLDTITYPDGDVVITRINVPALHRGQGHASDLLKRCCAQADQHGVTLVLQIVPSGGLDYDQLREFYARHGFERASHYNSMKRIARTKQLQGPDL